MAPTLPGKPRVRSQRRTGRRAYRAARKEDMNMIDITKAKSAIKAAQDAVQATVSATVAGLAKNPNDVKGLSALVKAGEILAKADEKLADAVEKATVKVKEEKEKKADKK